jgi:hypothetical protein
MDEGEIAARFEKRNMLNPPDPDLDIISQKNTITTRSMAGAPCSTFLQFSQLQSIRPIPRLFIIIGIRTATLAWPPFMKVSGAIEC